MGWVRVDDAFYDHAKFHRVGALGIAAWISGLAYANRNLTDGFIPHKAARGIIDTDGLGYYISNLSGRDAEPMDGVVELVTAGLWEEVSGGYQIHDYHDYQPSADKIKADRAAHAARQAAWRASKAADRGAVSDDVSGTDRDSVTDSGVTACPTPTPNPTEENPNLPQPAAAARAKPRKRRSSKPDLTDLQPLINALGRAGIQVSWDLDREQADDVRAARERCGIPALVKVAQRQHQPNNPAFSVKAFLGAWSTLPAKPTPLELVADPCHHGEVHPSKCALCRAEAGAA